MAAITEPLPHPQANLTVLRTLASALRAHLKPRPKPTKEERGRVIKERDRLSKRLREIDEFCATLRPDESGADWLAAKALEQVKAETRTALAVRSAWVHTHKRGANPDLDVLFGEALRIWTEAGGRLGVSGLTRHGGPLSRFMTAIMNSIGREPPTTSGLREIVDRWYPNRPR